VVLLVTHGALNTRTRRCALSYPFLPSLSTPHTTAAQNFRIWEIPRIPRRLWRHSTGHSISLTSPRRVAPFVPRRHIARLILHMFSDLLLALSSCRWLCYSHFFTTPHLLLARSCFCHKAIIYTDYEVSCVLISAVQPYRGVLSLLALRYASLSKLS
jgi:hypothetical protein